MSKFIEKHKVAIILSGCLLLLVLIMGGVKMHEQKQEEFQKQMVKEVKDHEYLMLKYLKEQDEKDFVKKITINYKTINHNPMGGINFEGYVNDDKNLDFSAMLEKTEDNGHEKYRIGPGAYPSELLKQMGEDNE